MKGFFWCILLPHVTIRHVFGLPHPLFNNKASFQVSDLLEVQDLLWSKDIYKAYQDFSHNLFRFP